LLVVPGRATSWQDSIVTPIPYAVDPPFTALAEASAPDHVRRAVHTIAGFTAVDGATILTDQYALIGFGAKIRRRQGHPQVDVLLHTEPILGNEPTRMSPAQLGGTRHLSAAQFISDQREGLALVASQDGRFTLLAWSPDEQIVHAHRIDALLV
jgi:hypothetical protein